MDLNFTYIKKALKYALLSLLVLQVCGVTVAQVKFRTVIHPESVAVDDYFQVDYIIEDAGSVENFAPPVFKNFSISQGPSRSENVSIINGAVSRAQSISYVLKPLSLGKQVVPGAMAVINGKTMRSNPAVVSVVKHGQARSAAPPNMPFMPMPDEPEAREEVSEEYRLLPGEDAKSKISKNLMAKLDVNKKTCYVGEPFIAAYKLYSKLKSESRITKRPSLNGFSVYDMDDPNVQRLSVEKLKGKSYNVHVIRRSQLLPLQAGTYVLDPIELDNKVEFLRTSSSGRHRQSSNPMERMMEDFFGGGQSGELEEYNVAIKSDPVTITVNPLPEENRPERFNGAVGSFAIKAALKKKIVSSGDVAELVLTIEGSGNLPMINPPQVDFPAGMETFEPAVKESIDKSVYPLKGSKTINYSFLARNAGDYTIPPVMFSFFDPVSATYKTVSSDSLTVKVEKSTRVAAKQPSADTAAGIDEVPLVSSGWTDIINREMLIGGSAIIVLIVLVIVLLKRSRKKADIPVAGQAPPPKAAATVSQPPKPSLPPISLEEASIALDQGKSQEFYSEINKGIREAMYRKTETIPSELTRFNMPFVLREKGVSVQTIQDLESIMKECEIALYTPIHEERDMRNMMEKAAGVIRELTV